MRSFLNELDKAKKNTFSKIKHCKLIDLGYTNIYHFNKLSDKRWNWYKDKGGKIYVEKSATETPLYKRIFFDKFAVRHLKKGSKFPPKEKAIKRTYKSGGQYGKAEGLNLYIQRNGKLTKSDRAKLLKLSEQYIEEIQSQLPKKTKIDFLDNSHSDIELIESWNKTYFTYGFMISKFKDKFERKSKSFKSSKNESFENTLTPKMKKILDERKKKYVDF